MAPTTRERPHTTGRLTRLLAATAVAVAAIGAFAAPAGAHAELESSDPAAGARLDAAPGSVALTFTDGVDAEPDAVRVYDRRGDRLRAGDARAAGADTVVAELPALDDGSYVVTWHVTSSDGHPVRGAFTFAVGTARPAVPEGLTERLLAAEGGSTSVGAAYALARYLSFGATLVLVGAVAFLLARWPDGFDDRARRWLLVTAVLAFVGALAGTILHPLHADARPLGDAFGTDPWSGALDTRVGRAWAARALLVAAFVPLVLLGRGPERAAWRRGASAVLGAALILTFTLAGHATTGRLVALGVAADVVHLAAVAVWLGGLVVVLFALRGPRSDDALRVAAPRFSSLALGAVGVIVASGVVQAWRQVGAAEALRETDYGRLLLFKTVLVVVIVVIASKSRDVVRRQLADDAAPVVGGAAVDEEVVESGRDDGVAVEEKLSRRLRRSVAIEVAYAVVVLGVTALLVNAAPPRGELSRPFAEIVPAGEVSFDVLLSPAQTGRNELHVTVIAPDGLAVPVEDVQVSFRQPERDIAAIDVPMRPVGTGHYIGSGVDLPIRGAWVLDVEARLTDVEAEQASVEIPVE